MKPGHLAPNNQYFKGDAGQNAPPGGNSCHTTYKTPQKVLAALSCEITKGCAHFMTVDEFSP